MNPDETARLAELLSKVPGFRGVDVKDVRRLVQLLRESPEVGSIEVKGLFGTGDVVTRTLSGAVPMPLPTAVPIPMPATQGAVPGAPAVAAPSALKEIKSPMVGTFYASPEPGAEPYIRVG